MKKNNFKTILSKAIVLTLCLFSLTGCSTNSATANPTENNNATLAAGGVLRLKVNPEVAITYDVDGNVTMVESRNDDAKKILADYTEYKGKAAKTVVSELVTAIGNAGYFVEEIEGESRQITIEIEAGSKLPNDTFLDEVANEVRTSVSNNQWNSSIEVNGESDYGVTDYVDTDYGTGNDGVTDYADTDYGTGNDGVTDYADTDYGTGNDGVTDYADTDYGTGNDGVTDYADTDYGTGNDGVTDYADTDYGTGNDGVTDYADTDYGAGNDGVTDYADTDYGTGNDGVTDYADTDYGTGNDGVTDYDDGASNDDDGNSNYDDGASNYDDGNSNYDDDNSDDDGNSDYDD